MFIVIKKRFHKFEIQVMIKKNKIPLSFKKIGYTDVKPDDYDYHSYESIDIKNKSGEKIKLYRSIDQKDRIDDTTNFSSSWKTYNNYLES